MFSTLRRVLKWGSPKSVEAKNQASYLMTFLIGILEDVLFWRKLWLSLTVILFFNIVFCVCFHQQINLLEFITYLCATLLCIDAIEAWLKYKHRTTCLKRLAHSGGGKLNSTAVQLNSWLRKKLTEYIYLRETNHTKAFLLVNIIFSIIFLVGKCINGYVLTYTLCMFICFFYKVVPLTLRFVKKLQTDVESDNELEGLIPDASDVNLKLLSVELEQNPSDDRQSLDYWKPEDLPLDEASDSSETSSSLITNLSIEKIQSLEKDVETSDSSEDEYIPLVQPKIQLQSTVEVIQPADTWSSSAYNAFRNFTGAVVNMMYTTQENKKTRSSIDSSDGFEVIDKNDLI